MAQKARVRRAIFTALMFLTLPTLAEVAGAQPRNRPSGGMVTFYAAPNGVDIGNNCLSSASPCTVQGAHDVAKRDWDFAGSGCEIRLAHGTYTSTVALAGTYLGTHLCQIWGDVSGPNNACTPGAPNVVFDVPPGKFAFDIQDGMMTSIRGITVTGASGGGFYGRQHIVNDLACVHCKDIAQCLSLTHHATANFGLDNWVSGTMQVFVGADELSIATIAGGAQITALGPTSIRYLLLSYHGSRITFANGTGSINNQASITGIGQPKPDCLAYWMGSITKSGLTIPCNETAVLDGKIY